MDEVNNLSANAEQINSDSGVKVTESTPTSKNSWRLITSLIILTSLIGFLVYSVVQNTIFRKDCGIDFTVRGTGMIPNYKDGDKVCVAEVVESTELKRGDVVIAELNAQDTIMKRVVGLPGEEVSFSKGELHINSQKLDEAGYIPSGLKTFKSSENNPEEEIMDARLENKQFYLLGDNRPESKKDSRSVGAVSRDKIKYVVTKKVS
ncbi:MAG: hypothetical protein OHK0017_10720 [Patescibacteria group bacterium]